MQRSVFSFASPAILPAELSEPASSDFPVVTVVQILGQELRDNGASTNSTKPNPTQLAYNLSKHHHGRVVWLGVRLPVEVPQDKRD